MAEITIKINGLNELIKGFTKAPKETFNQLTKAINTSAWLITTNVKAETPSKTGALKRGIRPKFGKLSAKIQPHNAPYAYWVHQGTKPYTIRPKKGGGLFWDGAPHPMKIVHHPGIKSQPFMDEGLDKSKSKVKKIFDKHVDNILKVIVKK